MMQQNIVFLASKTLFFDIVWDFLYFPIWWYTVGLQHTAVNSMKNINAMAGHLALRLLVLNIFKPMFAQTDRAGRIISFFMRVVILIARAIFFFIYTLLQLVLIIGWIIVPALIVYRLLSIFILSYV
ncbi:MAG: hypothetical protein AAB490_01710 [Patescibacteria group bacterium]